MRGIENDAWEPIMVRQVWTQRAPPPEQPYPAEKARGGEIILNTPLKRGLFVAGLAGAVALALVLSFAR